MSQSANKFQMWCDLYRLTLNMDKSKYMLFINKTTKKRKEFNSKETVRIGDYVMSPVNEYKYLGIILDDCLTFASYVRMLNQSIS